MQDLPEVDNLKGFAIVILGGMVAAALVWVYDKYVSPKISA